MSYQIETKDEIMYSNIVIAVVCSIIGMVMFYFTESIVTVFVTAVLTGILIRISINDYWLNNYTYVTNQAKNIIGKQGRLTNTLMTAHMLFLVAVLIAFQSACIYGLAYIGVNEYVGIVLVLFGQCASDCIFDLRINKAYQQMTYANAV